METTTSWLEKRLANRIDEAENRDLAARARGWEDDLAGFAERTGDKYARLVRALFDAADSAEDACGSLRFYGFNEEEIARMRSFAASPSS